MLDQLPQVDGLLILPRLRIQNANAISSQMTWGFPSMTAFFGLMQALERKLAPDSPLMFESVGVICHGWQDQTNGRFVKRFNLSRNPLDKDGSTAAIVEEGRIHLDITLVFGVGGTALSQDAAQREQTATTLYHTLMGMRVAGGSIVSASQRQQRFQPRPQLVGLGEQGDPKRAEQFRQLSRHWLPGFALVSRDDLLGSHHAMLQQQQADATLLDAWLDKSRLNHWPETNEQGHTEWKHSRQPGAGWIVPIPVGYRGLSPLYPAGEVKQVRDSTVPFRFVENVYSLGEWISPHRLADVTQLLWYSDMDDSGGPTAALYRCRNDYTPSTQNTEFTAGA